MTKKLEKPRRGLKITDRVVEQIREHFAGHQDPPISWLAATFGVSETYISDILRYYRRQDTSLNRRVDRRIGLAPHPYPIIGGRKSHK